MNNVASEFVNLVPAETFDKIDLVVKYNAAGNENILVHNSVDLVGMTPYTQKHMIPSHEVDKVVKTTTSAAYVHVSGDDKYYTAEELYAEYGYYVDIQKSSFVTSYKKDNTLDIPVTIADLCWEDSINMWNESKFNVVNSDLIGSAREVSLTSYEEADKLKYDQRVGDYLAVVDSYFLGGQQVAVADKVEITKNLVYVNFEATAYDWTLQRALDLRGEDGTPYANTIVLKDVKYDNIYDLNPLLAAENVIETSTKLNYVDNSTPISIKNIVAPKAGTAGKAEIWIEKGYAFATAKAAKENTYVKTWKANLSETTDAIVTVTVTLGKYPEAVVVESEAELTLQTEGSLVNNFKGADALIADAYAALTAEKAGFAANAKANDLLYAALTDEANKVVNDPNSAYNLNFVVNDNKDESFVLLYHSQIKDVANVQPTYTFKRDITTWFGVPFQFVVTGKPQLPKAELVRSTEYAHATDVEDVYLVNLQAGLVGGVYTVAQSDLAFYLNVIGAAHHSQKVSFAVVEGVADIANKVTSVDPLETPINNPLVGDVTAYLAKTNSILTWKDNGTEVKVKATLWAGAYPIDYATVILKVVDPLTFVAKGATVERKIKEDTEIKVYKNFSLTSIVDEHKNIPNLIDVNAASLENTIADVYKTAYGADLKIEKVTVYEKVDDTEAGQVLYDDSKYTWNPTTGIFKLMKDDANELINPIVAKFHVTFTHKVHANTDPCHVTNDIEIVIVDPAK